MRHEPPNEAEALKVATYSLTSRINFLDRVLARIYDGELREHSVHGRALSMLVEVDAPPARRRRPRWGKRLELGGFDRGPGSWPACARPGSLADDGGLRVAPARRPPWSAPAHPTSRRAQRRRASRSLLISLRLPVGE